MRRNIVNVHISACMQFVGTFPAFTDGAVKNEGVQTAPQAVAAPLAALP